MSGPVRRTTRRNAALNRGKLCRRRLNGVNGRLSLFAESVKAPDVTMTTDDTDGERSERRKWLESQSSTETDRRRRGDASTRRSRRRSNRPTNPQSAPSDASVDRYENGGREGEGATGKRGQAWNAGNPDQSTGAPQGGPAQNRRYGSRPPSRATERSETETADPTPTDPTPTEPAPSDSTPMDPDETTDTSREDSPPVDENEESRRTSSEPAPADETPRRSRAESPETRAQPGRPGEQPKRTQPMREPTPPAEQSPRGDQPTGDRGTESRPPERYGGPVDPSWQRTRNSRRERTMRRYEQQFNRQQERQRDIQRGKGSNEFRRGR